MTWGMVGTAGYVGVTSAVAAGAALPQPEGVNPDTIMSYYMGAKYYGAPGAGLGMGLGGYIGSRLGGTARGKILGALLGGGMGAITGGLIGTSAGAGAAAQGAMVGNRPGMTEQFLSAGTMASLSQIAALNANIARLHRPIRGMGY